MTIENENKLTDEQVELIASELENNQSENTKILREVLDSSNNEPEELEKVEVQYVIDPDTGIGNPIMTGDGYDIDDNITLEELAEMSTADIKDMAITPEMLHNSDITKDITDDEAIELLNFISKYESGEKFNFYNEMPKFMKSSVNEMFMQFGGEMSKQDIAKFVMDNLIQELKLDQAIIDLNETIKNELSLPSLTEMYAEFMKDNFENTLKERANEIRELNPEKAKLLEDISETYSKTYTFVELLEGLKNRKVRQFIKDPSRYKKMCNAFNRKYIESKFKITNIELCGKVIANCIPELEEDYIKKFIMLICKVCENKDSNDIIDHVFMYYTIQNIRLLEHDKLDNEFLLDKRSDMYMTITSNICKVIDTIKEYESMKPTK